jgi:serine/threonine protein phosphatase PrpC
MLAGMRFVSHGLTDIGLVRQRNEDALLDRPDIGLWAVADGMGGHQAGDEASAAVVAALGALTPPADLEDFVDEVKTRLLLTDRALRRRAARLGRGAVVASTVVTLLAYGDDFACIWAGDSRLYQWRAGELYRLSADHNRAQELVAAGLLTEAQAALHPAASVVTQAIGAGRLTFGTRAGMLRPGDRFLLCSDGLTSLVKDVEIGGELAAAPPRGAAERLRRLVLARGAGDNVTVVIVAVEAA